MVGNTSTATLLRIGNAAEVNTIIKLALIGISIKGVVNFIEIVDNTLPKIKNTEKILKMINYNKKRNKINKQLAYFQYRSDIFWSNDNHQYSVIVAKIFMTLFTI